MCSEEDVPISEETRKAWNRIYLEAKFECLGKKAADVTEKDIEIFDLRQSIMAIVSIIFCQTIHVIILNSQ